MERKEAKKEFEKEFGVQIPIQSDNFTYKDDKGNEKVAIGTIVEYLIKKYHFKTTFGTKTEKIYLYEEGIYNLKGKEKIKTETERLLDNKCTTNIVNEVVEKVKRKTAVDIVEFEKNHEELICLENGVLNTKEQKLYEYDKKYNFKNKLPLFYDKDAESKEILKFFNEIIYPEELSVIQEWFGFCLYKKYFIKKAIILFGEKNTGKTVFLNILSNFIGTGNHAGINLQRISRGDKFALSSLKGKFLNFYDDLSAGDLSDSGGFKIAVGGGYITAEEKFGDSFQFLTFAKNIFATNLIPNVKDINDDAYYERWIPLPFDNQIDKTKQDNFLINKLITKEEMSGLLNWALEGLKRLLENGRFSYDKTSEEIKQIMQRQNNPLIAFVEDALIQKDGNRIDKETMFKVYTYYCKEHKVQRMSKNQLGRNLEKYAFYIISKGGRERVWENVQIKAKYGEVLITDMTD